MSNQDNLNKYYDEFCESQQIDEINPKKRYGKQKTTFAMYLAQKGIIPHRIYKHDSELQDRHGKTVQYYLKKQKLDVPKYWQIEDNTSTSYSTYSTDDTDTDQYLDKEIQQKLQQFCQKYDIDNQQLVINDPCYQKNKGQSGDFTFAIWLGQQGIIPPKQFEHDSQLQIVGWTVALGLASKGVIPPSCWEHDPQIKTLNNKTVQDYLRDYNVQVPEQWQIEDKIDQKVLDMLDEYCRKYKVTKQTIIDNPEWQGNEDKKTFAMYLAWNGILPPKEFQHDSKIQNKFGDTVAVQLEINKIQVPEQWKYNSLYKLKNGMTTAMRIASYGKIPSEYWKHRPTIQDDYEYTVAIYLEKKGVQIPKQWQYDPLFKLKGNRTTAMIMANNSIVPSSYWNHDPNIKDNIGFTVALYLFWRNIIPPRQWQHDPKLKDNLGNTVQDYLRKKNIKVPPEWQY